MSIERAREYFAKLGMADRVIEFPVSSATVELAVRPLIVNRPEFVRHCRFLSTNNLF